MIGIYARVSTEDQARHGYSLEDQIARCREKANSNDIKEYIDDGVSGEILDRPAMMMLRQDVRDGLIEKVICLDPDRLSRKLMNQLIITDELDKRGVELIFVNGEYAKTPDGNLFYSIRGAIAEFEKAKINERMSSGRKRKARTGKVVKNSFTYGYDFDGESSELIINEREAEIVRLIFDLFTQPNDLVKGINGIAIYLTEKQVPTKRGASVWHRQVVRQILLNETYTGVFHQNKWNTEGCYGNKHRKKEDRVSMTERPREEWISVECPQIIDKEQFFHAQKLLAESRRRYTKESHRKYLLSGLVRCGKCGNTMTGRRSKDWGKYIFHYTDIKKTSGAKFRGCRNLVVCEKLDEHVWNAVFDWLNRPDEIAASAERNKHQPNGAESFEHAELARLEKELEKTKAGRKRLLSLFADMDDGIGEDDIREKLKEMKSKEDRLNQQISELRIMIESYQEQEFSMSTIKQATEYYLSFSGRDLTFEEKQNIIRMIVREVRVYDDKTEIYTF